MFPALSFAHTVMFFIPLEPPMKKVVLGVNVMFVPLPLN
jgi:hypothetical protein